LPGTFLNPLPTLIPTPAPVVRASKRLLFGGTVKRLSARSLRPSVRSLLRHSACEALEERRLLSAPVLSAIADQSVPDHKTLEVPLQTTDADGDPITYTVSVNNNLVTPS